MSIALNVTKKGETMRMPKVGDIIKHDEFTDVAFSVTAVYVVGADIAISGNYVNQGVHKSYLIPVPSEEIRLKTQQLVHWLVCEEPQATCIRNVPWARMATVGDILDKQGDR